MRFYYNLGIEYFKLLQQVHGHGAVMSMIDGDAVTTAYDQPSNDGSDGQSGQMISEFQNFNIEANEGEIQSPSKVIIDKFSLKLFCRGCNCSL